MKINLFVRDFIVRYVFLLILIFFSVLVNFGREVLFFLVFFMGYEYI